MDLTGNREEGSACYLLLGSNEGDSLSVLEDARNKISMRIGKIEKKSSLYKTEPWGMESKNWFFNQVLLVNSNKKPVEILELCLQIEKEAGRERNFNGMYEDRALDIDLLLYGNAVIDEIHLHIPHPRLHERRFVLVPLAEINPEVMHPIMDKTIGDLLRETEDNTEVIKAE